MHPKESLGVPLKLSSQNKIWEILQNWERLCLNLQMAETETDPEEKLKYLRLIEVKKKLLCLKNWDRPVEC